MRFFQKGEFTMGHGMTEFDNAVFHREPAWHGLGVVVEDAPTVYEALKIAGMDYTIDQLPLFFSRNGEREIVESHVLNYRKDADVIIGVVSSKYVPIQNEEMAEFCDAILDEGVVKVESAGTIQSGAQAWFLLKGDPFEVANGDEIFPYICVSNGHDGKATFRVTPTTIRVQCENTLDMVVPRGAGAALGNSAISMRHTVNVMQRVKEAQRALKNYTRSLDKFRKVVDTLVKVDVKSDDVKQFFMDCYTHDFGEIPMNPSDAWEDRRRMKAMDAYNSFSVRFDDDRKIAGTNLWNAFNAYSGLVQHDRKARGSSDAHRIETRAVQNLFGLNQTRTIAALQHAYKMALAV